MSSGAVVGGRYLIEKTLGGGGMALVYAAHDESLDRRVAVKVLADNLAAHTEIRLRFLQEARIAAALSHPNIVEVYDSGEDEDGRPYIVMECIEGPTLAQELRRRGRLPAGEATTIAEQTAAGLAHAHAAGIVHRDVKPENLLLSADGGLKIADFGIAHAVDGTRLTSTGSVLGTAAYLAPEQARGESVTPAADVYALGAVLHELLTGRPPHAGATLAELLAAKLEEPNPPSSVDGSVPPALNAVVERCLAVDPRQRPSAVEVRDALRGNAETLTRVVTDSPTRVLQPGTGGRRAWMAALAAAILIGGGAFVVVASQAGGSGAEEPASAPRIARIPSGATPAEHARNLARWLRRYSCSVNGCGGTERAHQA